MDYSQFLKYQQCMPENVITQLRYSRGENVSQRLYIEVNQFLNTEGIKMIQTVINMQQSENRLSPWFLPKKSTKEWAQMTKIIERHQQMDCGEHYTHTYL